MRTGSIFTRMWWLRRRRCTRSMGELCREIASRQHMVTIVPVLRQALDEAGMRAEELDGVAVTHGPGLAGALLIGVNAAKGFSLANELPFIGLNHLEGHIYAAWLEDGVNPERSPGFPLMCLIASGRAYGLDTDEGTRRLYAYRAHSRRRGGRGVRQGGARAGARLSRRA